MKSGKLQVAFNLGLAALFSALLGLMLPAQLATGSTLVERLSTLPSVIVAGIQAAPRAFVASSLIPIAVSITCGAFLLTIATSRDSRRLVRSAFVATAATAILVAVAAILQGGVPMLALALVPLAFACVAAGRIKLTSSPASG